MKKVLLSEKQIFLFCRKKLYLKRSEGSLILRNEPVNFVPTIVAHVESTKLNLLLFVVLEFMFASHNAPTKRRVSIEAQIVITETRDELGFHLSRDGGVHSLVYGRNYETILLANVDGLGDKLEGNLRYGKFKHRKSVFV